MKFDEVQSTDSMQDLSIQVADDIRDHVREIYVRMIQRSSELEDGLPNVVLAGLTLVWIETVYNVFGSASYESAVRLLSGIRPDDAATRKCMKRAAADVLRRSGWGMKRRKA
jgi:hypothetical protein